MRKFGLIGKDISYSFSRKYFHEKFTAEGIDARYDNFDCLDVAAVKTVLQDIAISGYNVTIPYKELVLPLLDAIEGPARTIGAVNTIKRTVSGHLIGYNTDYLGFKASLPEVSKMTSQQLQSANYGALILGTGGAAKAIVFALQELGIQCTLVSRQLGKLQGGIEDDERMKTLNYQSLTNALMQAFKFVINTTPLGTFPRVEEAPQIPYIALSPEHVLVDLVYNPEETLFLKKGRLQGAKTANGLRMLQLQADFAWSIWNHTG